MGRLPAVVIVVRHGARLDAADNKWHLTSPTPYDTPLTYGGWTQSRALGARIASLLQARETSAQTGSSGVDGETSKPSSSIPPADGNKSSSYHSDSGSPKRRKHRVVMHTSPYMRCVQTSIGISAGMAQYHGLSQMSSPTHLSRSAQDIPFSSSLSSIQEPENDQSLEPDSKQEPPSKFQKVTLRVDAFLGEWLNPDYFDTITPPPSSPMMVVGAKADLLRPGDYHEEVVIKSANATTLFPGGWGNTADPKKTKPEGGPLSSISNLAEALPRRDRSSSHSSVGRRNLGKSDKLSPAKNKDHGGYFPPTPSYAISSNDPVPSGYINHARDACIDVDYQWDSMRDPHDWGTGGDYGEEWGPMHKRCRGALQAMLSWYRVNDPAADQELTPTATDGEVDQKATEGDSETETVLILVSHGAVCNALIGGLTDRAVLLDVGMASLTMAVRHEDMGGISGSTNSRVQASPSSSRRKSSVSIPISDDYDVKLMASTEHLRAGANPLAVPQLQSPRISAPSISAIRNRWGPGASQGDSGFGFGDIGYRSSTSSAIGSIRRSTYGAGSPHGPKEFTASPGSSPIVGLWHRPEANELREDEAEDGSDDSMILNFGDSDRTKELKRPELENSELSDAELKRADLKSAELKDAELQAETSSTWNRGRASAKVRPGLWGSGGASEDIRESEGGLLRRWTINDASQKKA